MASNYKSSGDVINYKNGTGGAIASGDPVFDGFRGIALVAIAIGEIGAVKTSGIFEMAKDTSTAIAQGAPVYWNVSSGKITDDPSDEFLGFAVEAADTAIATIEVLLVQDAGGASTPVAAEVVYAAGANLVGVDGTSDNAAPLVETEARLDALDTGLGAVISALQAAGLMA